MGNIHTLKYLGPVFLGILEISPQQCSRVNEAIPSIPPRSNDSKDNVTPNVAPNVNLNHGTR